MCKAHLYKQFSVPFSIWPFTGVCNICTNAKLQEFDPGDWFQMSVCSDI